MIEYDMYMNMFFVNFEFLFRIKKIILSPMECFIKKRMLNISPHAETDNDIGIHLFCLTRRARQLGLKLPNRSFWRSCFYTDSHCEGHFDLGVGASDNITINHSYYFTQPLVLWTWTWSTAYIRYICNTLQGEYFNLPIINI